MGDQSADATCRVPPGDIDYVVENALWIAHANQMGPRPPHLDPMRTFFSAVERHWAELVKLHQATDDSAGSQQATVVESVAATDGGERQ